MQRLRPVVLALCFTVLISTLSTDARPDAEAWQSEASDRSRPAFAGLPLAFVPNVGQWDVPAEFVVRRGAMLVRLEKGALVVQVENVTPDGSRDGAMVRMAFEGGDASAEIAAGRRRPGRYNFFLGADPASWRSEVPVYESARYRGLYDGIDLRVRDGGGAIEYDVIVESGADLSQFAVRCDGIEGLKIGSDGALIAGTAVGDLTMQPPTSWHIDESGKEIPVPCRFSLLGEDRFGFEVVGRRSDLTLVVDPILTFSTFVGGSGPDWGRDVAIDSQDHTLVTGQMNSPVFPSTTGAYRTTPYGVDDAYVLRVTPDGKQLAFATFLGGTGGDTGWGLALDANDAITIVGQTGSSNFPTTSGAWDTTLGGPQDTFVTRLAPNGAALVFSTFVGGSGRDWGKKIAVDSTGASTVVGHTTSSNFPTTTGAYDTSYNGKRDGFVVSLAADGKSLIYGTYLGGDEDDEVRDVALGPSGEAFVAGVTSSANFPATPGAYDATHNGMQDAFAGELAVGGVGLAWATFLGGAENDVANGVAVNRNGIVAVGGRTKSAGFPTTVGAYQTVHVMHDDAFITQLLVNGSVLGYSTYLGATRVDDIEDVHIESNGVVTATGNSTGGGLSGTPGAYDPTFNGAWDPFIVRMGPGGERRYMTFFGANNNDNFRATALDGANVATAVGNSGSANFPTSPGAFDTTHNGNNDIIVVRLDLLPTGVRAYGESSPGCDGPLAMDVTSMPSLGTANWEITCTNAPPSSTGFFGLSTQGLTTPISLQGIDVWIDTAGPVVFIFPANSDTAGAASMPLPIPNDPLLVGFRVYTQFVWSTPTSPVPCPALGASASNALAITFQR